MKNLKKLAALLLTVLMVFALFAACGKDENQNEEPDKTDDTQIQQNEENQTEEPEPAHEDKIVIALATEPTSLNPYDHAAVVSGYMNQLTYNRLFKYDIDTLQPVPDLVESYENVDEVTWSFTLKENIQFHDGTVMTSEDVKASMEFARGFTSSNKYTSFWQSVDIVDDRTFTITTNGPYALILDDLAANGNTIVPKHLIDEGNDFNQNPIGSGPYKFVAWDLGTSLTFVKNDNYFDTEHQPQITDMVWRIIPEGSSRTIALETGEVDLIIDVESTDVGRIRSAEGFELEEVDGLRMAFFSVNNENPMFSDPLVRKAINALIDKEAVVQVAVNGQGVASVSMNPIAYMGVTEEGADVYDPDKAMEYLRQANVDPADLHFTCMAYTDETRRSAEVIQGCLQQAGITMEIESLDFAAWLERLLAGDFEAAVGGFSSSNVLTYMRGLWHTSTIGATNNARISDPQIDSLIEQAEATLDEAARTEIVTQISKLTNEATPFMPLYTTSVIRAFNADLQGTAVSAAGLMYYSDLRWAD